MSFGSPAADYINPRLDLNRYLVPHPVSSYFVRMDNDRLNNEGVLRGDILVIDRSLTPKAGQLIIVIEDNQFKAQRLQKRQVSSGNTTAWGVVTAVIRSLS